MRVRMGWTGELDETWQKVDVSLDEVDLVRLLTEAGVGDGVVERLSTKIAFRLLKNEAEFLLLTRLRELGYPEQAATQRQGLLAGQNEAVLAVLTKRYPGE